jgi:hypothetical protein
MKIYIIIDKSDEDFPNAPILNMQVFVNENDFIERLVSMDSINIPLVGKEFDSVEDYLLWLPERLKVKS